MMNKFQSKVVKHSAVVCLALLMAGCATTSSSVSTKYYSIRGANSDQLDAELRDKGPLRGHALASAAIKFEPVAVFQKTTSDGCSFESAKFRVKANITLPRWENRSQSKDTDLKRAWDFLEKYAKVHEHTHVAIAEKYASKLETTLMALPAEKTCEQLDRKAATAAKKISRDHDRAQLKFDADEQKRLAQLFKQ